MQARTSAVQWLLGVSDSLAEASTLRQTVQQKILEMEEGIRELKEYQNSLSPAITLPPEILASIFEMHLNRHNEEHTLRCLPKDSLGWIRITHVCRRWREVAIDCPTLWSTLSFRHPEFTEIMLRRSRDAPLDIFHVYQPNSPEALFPMVRKALAQTGRLRTVHLKLDAPALTDGTIFSTILADLANTAPNLQTLVLTNYALQSQDYPDNFLGGHSPSLKELTLTRFPPSLWKALPFGSTSLKNLTLRSPTSRGPITEDFLNALRLMPSLRKMNLWNNIPRARSQSLPPENRVTLPALETLQIWDDSDAIHGFFTILILPKLTAVHITNTEVRMEDFGAVNRALGLFAESCDRFRHGALARFHIGETFNDGTQFIFSYGGEAALDLIFYQPAMSLQRFITMYHAQLDLSTISTLSIVKLSSMPMNGGTWTATLSSLPELKHISIESSRIEGFLDALKIRPKEGSPHHFPALSSITLEGVQFHPAETEGYGAFANPASTTSNLIEGILWREVSCRVHTLKILNCVGFFEQDFLQIQAALPKLEVVWDRFEEVRRDWEELEEF